jgi:hypothetical protein
MRPVPQFDEDGRPTDVPLVAGAFPRRRIQSRQYLASQSLSIEHTLEWSFSDEAPSWPQVSFVPFARARRQPDTF